MTVSEQLEQVRIASATQAESSGYLYAWEDLYLGVKRIVPALRALEGEVADLIRQRDELVEVLMGLLELAEQAPHHSRLCGTTTILANGSFFIEGCACGRDAAIEDARAILKEDPTND